MTLEFIKRDIKGQGGEPSYGELVNVLRDIEATLRDIKNTVTDTNARVRAGNVPAGGSDLLSVLRDIDTQIRMANLDPKFYKMVPLNVDTHSLIPKGERRIVLDKQEEGFLVALSINTNNPDATVKVYVDDNWLAGSATELKDAGLTYPNTRTFWLSVYDDTNQKYTAWLTPLPYMHYYAHFKFEAQAPADEDVYYWYSIYRYVRRPKT